MNADEPVIDPATGQPEPYPLRFMAGSAPGVSFRVRGPRMGSEEDGVPKGAIVRWKRVAVITGRKAASPAEPNSYRFFELELAPDLVEQRIDFEGFHVRGQFRIVRLLNNERAARQAWIDFEAESR